MTNFTKEEATNELRFFPKMFMTGPQEFEFSVPPTLQQKWKVTKGSFGQVKYTEEWRDVPTVAAATAGTVGLKASPAKKPSCGYTFDLVTHIHRARAFSEKTFGPGARTKGVIEHIRKELDEILAEPDALEEWVDVIILAIDGAWRAGYLPEEIAAMIDAKQTKNERRKWPDWRAFAADEPIEHDRRGEQGFETR